MTRWTLAVYRYFKSHKAVFYIILIATTLVFAGFGSQVQFDEDITSLLPPVEQGGSEKMVFSNLQVKDKIFVLFHGRTDEVWPEDLIEVCDEFVAALEERDAENPTIRNIVSRIDESLLTDGIGFLYENVPAFLEEHHYPLLDSLLTTESMDRQMAENYRTLASSSGAALKDVITHDPIGLRKVFLPDTAALAGSKEDDEEKSGYTLCDSHILSADQTIAVAFISPQSKAYDSGTNTRLADRIDAEIERFSELYPDVEILYHGTPVQSVNNSRRIKTDLLLTVTFSLAVILVLLLICFRNGNTILHLLCPVIYGVLFALAVIYFIKGSMSLMALGIGAIVMGVAFSYVLHVLTHFKYVNDAEQVIKDQTVPVFLGSLTTIGAFAGLLLTNSELLRDFGLFASLGLIGTTVFSLLFLPQFFNPKKNKKSEKAFRILEKINSYPLERQKWLIIGIVVFSIACFIASFQVGFDADLQNIGYNNPQVVRSQQLLEEKTSGSTPTIHFAATGETLDDALESSQRLARKLEEEKRDGRIVSYTPVSSLFVPEQQQIEQIERWNNYWTGARKAEVRQQVRQAAANQKFAPDTFEPFFAMLDADYRPVSLYDAGVIPDELLDNLIEQSDGQYMVFTPVRMERARLMEVGRAVTDDDPDLVVVAPMFYTGNMVEMIHDDFNTALTISSLFVLLVLLLTYRNVVLALIGFLPMSLSWYIVLGVMAMAGLEFNLINIVISAFIFGVGVDYSIFVMDGLLARYRRNYSPLLTYHKTAICLSAVILIVVIGSLLFAVHPAISSIGFATLVGMAATILIAYSLQPFLFNIMVRWRTKQGKPPVPGMKKNP